MPVGDTEIMQQQRRLCFVAGRSGGHILPGLTLAQRYKEQQNASIIFFSTATTLDTTIINSHSMVDAYIPLALDNVPRRISGYPLFLVHVIKAFVTSLYHLRKLRPEEVISMGGYISIPVCLAARLLRIPVDIFELNALPGKATRFLAPAARTVYTCFKSTATHLPKAHCSLASYPIRFNVRQHKVALHTLFPTFSSNRKTLFVVGGSQGSLFINSLIKEWLEACPDIHNSVQVIHQTGAQDTTDWHSFYAHYNIPAHIFAYHNKIDDYYAAADLIICRSGAGTLHEILFFGKQCITIPLETASTDHQVENAKSMTQHYPDLFTVVYQKDILTAKPSVFAHIIQRLHMPDQDKSRTVYL